MVFYLWEYGLALALVTWPTIIIQRAVNWGIQLYEQLKTNRTEHNCTEHK